MPLFFWFDNSLDYRAEICQIFSLVKFFILTIVDLGQEQLPSKKRGFILALDFEQFLEIQIPKYFFDERKNPQILTTTQKTRISFEKMGQKLKYNLGFWRLLKVSARAKKEENALSLLFHDYHV